MKANLKEVWRQLFSQSFLEDIYKLLAKNFDQKIGLENLADHLGIELRELKQRIKNYDPELLPYFMEASNIVPPIDIDDIIYLALTVKLTWEDEKLMLEFFTKLKEDLRKFAKEDKRHVKELLESAGYGKLDYKMIEALRRRLERKEENFRKEFVDSIENKEEENLGELKIWQ